MCFFSFCKTYTPESFTKKKINFGSGGGFTGQVTEYCLLENGQLFVKKNTTEEYISLKSISKKKTKKLFSTLDSLQLEKIEHNQPANMYHFLSVSDQKNSHRLVWSVNDKPFTKEVGQFIDSLQTIIPTSSIKK
ncbi:MAG TPA: hypothetical protein ENK52_02095 [Saprospiraceae bacterium]|nr:hypothetical protein [Saprospiraceae bacterium]